MLPHPSSELLLHAIHSAARTRSHSLYGIALANHFFRAGLGAHQSLGFELGSILVEFGSLGVLHKLASQNVRSLNFIITVLTKRGRAADAILLYQNLKEFSMLLGDGYMALVKACVDVKDLDVAREFYNSIAKQDILKQWPFVGNALIDMYGKLGLLGKAKMVFNNLLVRDIVSWNALISGFARHESGERALDCFEQMQFDGIHPDAITFVSVLKACGNVQAWNKGIEIHIEVERKCMSNKNVIIGNALVDMYAKCGLLNKAQEVFEMLEVRDSVTWNAIISGYANNDQGKRALKFYDLMCSAGVFPNAVTFVAALKACGSVEDIERGQQIHSEIIRIGILQRNLLLGNALVDMYAKCGFLVKAQEVFDRLLVRDTDTWNALMSGYVRMEFCHEVLDCFREMQLDGVAADIVTYICSLKACTILGDAEMGKKLHTDVVRKDLLDGSLVLGSVLLDMYANCGLLVEAHELFSCMPVHDVVVWNSLIIGYAQYQHGHQALLCFVHMVLHGILPNAVTYYYLLIACSSIKDSEKGKEIHQEIIKKGFLDGDPVIINALVDMYAECQMLAEAEDVFDKLSTRDVVSWTALIKAYANKDRNREALNCFEQMWLEGNSYDAITLACGLKSCGKIEDRNLGGAIHAEIVRKGILESDPVIGCALVDMYVKFGEIITAQEVFNNLFFRDKVSWNAIISGYSKFRDENGVANCIEQMQLEGIHPDTTTYLCSLKAFSSISLQKKARRTLAEIVAEGLMQQDPFVANTIVDIYVSHGELEEAQKMFDKIPVQNLISWNMLITGYVNYGFGDKALTCFDSMQVDAIAPDSITYICSLKACGSIGAIVKGQEIHAEISRQGLSENDVMVCNALIGMYSKCGAIAKAQETFYNAQVHDVTSWNVLICGYLQKGENDNVFVTFENMIEEGQVPDSITFLILLSACNHSGLLDKINTFYNSMVVEFGVSPSLKHHTCIIDALVQGGQFDEALTILQKMSFKPDTVVWQALLNACRKLGNVKLGGMAFQSFVNEPTDAAMYSH